MGIRNLWLTALAVLMIGAGTAYAADHGDTPLLKEVGRPDARLTDLYAFTVGNDLVLVMDTNPAIPAGVTDYVFPSDVKFRILIDNDSEVSFSDPVANDEFGGAIVDPAKVSANIELRFQFKADGTLQVVTTGLDPLAQHLIYVLADLRDDPFIRTTRDGRNIGAIVVQMPLSMVLGNQDTLLIWGTSKVDTFSGGRHELAARALRSQFPENDVLNTLKPAAQFTVAGETPDVLIFDTSSPAGFPNGRALTDDVVDLVCDLANECRVSILEGQGGKPRRRPRANDKSFLQDFPYLAEPHL